MTTSVGSIDWKAWLQRWDAQQTRYLPDREERFAIMLDAVEATAGTEFRALDLACGPGAISQRVCERFPGASVVAVDLDPVLLRLGREAVGDAGGRIAWGEADLNSDDWDSQFEPGSFDAILSTTALHWLPRESLAKTYAKAYGLLRPGGILLNGDHMRFEADQVALHEMAELMKELRSRAAREEAEDWTAWWDALQEEPGLEELFAERARRFDWRDHTNEEAVVTFGGHRKMMLSAGFGIVESIWQRMENRVLVGIR